MNSRSSGVELRRCSILITGFSADMSDQYKDQLIRPAVSKGGVVKWLTPYIALAVFVNESKAQHALSDGYLSPIRLQLVSTIDEDSNAYDEGRLAYSI